MGLLLRIRKLLGFSELVVLAEKPTAPEMPAIEREFQRQLYEQIALQFTDLSIEISNEALLFGMVSLL
jgi:hypothetical protein